VAITAKNVQIDVLANDEPNATLSSIGKPKHGRATIVKGRVIYVSDDNFDGEDSFDYWITLPTGEKLQGNVVLQVKGNRVTRLERIPSPSPVLRWPCWPLDCCWPSGLVAVGKRISN
jgi:Bacterial Ig domain